MLIRKLESIFTLTDDERDALINLPMQVMDPGRTRTSCAELIRQPRRSDPAAAGSGKNLGRYAASWIACWPRPRRPSSTAALTWSTRWAPRGDQRICLRLFMRALTRWLTVPSAREVEIGLPAR